MMETAVHLKKIIVSAVLVMIIGLINGAWGQSAASAPDSSTGDRCPVAGRCVDAITPPPPFVPSPSSQPKPCVVRQAYRPQWGACSAARVVEPQIVAPGGYIMRIATKGGAYVGHVVLVCGADGSMRQHRAYCDR